MKNLLIFIGLLVATPTLAQNCITVSGFCYTYNESGERFKRETCTWQFCDSPVENSKIASDTTNPADGITISDASTIACKLFPNPTTGMFRITFSTVMENIEMSMLDVSGKMVGIQKAKATNTLEYDATAITPGSYIVYVVANKHRYQFKLIRQ